MKPIFPNPLKVTGDTWSFAMVIIYRTCFFVLLIAPLLAMGDGCTDEAPIIEKYAKNFQCPAVTIRAEGEKYPEETWECFDIVPIKREALFYTSGINKGALTSINSLLPSNEKDFKNRTWMVSSIICSGKEKIKVRYWGGGNCKGCERMVQYHFSKDGKLVDAKLQ